MEIEDVRVIRVSRRLLCLASTLRVLGSNRRATLVHCWNRVPWLRSKEKAANRGYATVATCIFNSQIIKAKNAFMIRLQSPNPFEKGLRAAK